MNVVAIDIKHQGLCPIHGSLNRYAGCIAMKECGNWIQSKGASQMSEDMCDSLLI